MEIDIPDELMWHVRHIRQEINAESKRAGISSMVQEDVIRTLIWWGTVRYEDGRRDDRVR